MMKKYVRIFFATPLIILWITYGPSLFQGFFNLDKEWRIFIPILGLSILGVGLYFLRRHHKSNPHWIDSMSMLIIGIGPSTASFNLLPKDDIGRILMPVFVILVSVIWFVYFGILIKPQTYKNDSEKIKREEFHIKQTKYSALVFFLFLLILSITMFWSINILNQFLP